MKIWQKRGGKPGETCIEVKGYITEEDIYTCVKGCPGIK